MSGELNLPLLTTADASKLLDEIIYERVLSCIDVDTLLTFECELSCAFDECGFDGRARGPDLAKEMIDRAIHRVRDERWNAHLRGSRSSGGAPWDCDLCEQAPAAPKPSKRTSS